MKLVKNQSLKIKKKLKLEQNARQKIKTFIGSWFPSPHLLEKKLEPISK